VQPSSYLRPRGFSHPMRPSEPERAIDREEREGLVSLPLFLLFSLLFLVILCCLQLFIFFYCNFFLAGA
jgi:hypothetical protein